MFKSKGFTIGFILLCMLNLLLVAGLIYVSSGRADDTMKKITETTTAESGTRTPTGSIPDETGSTDTMDMTDTTDTPDTTDMTEATDAPTSAPSKAQRALTTEDPHTMPVVSELIPEKGSLSINESSAFGVVFHKLPAFDSAEAEGNVIYYRGTFETDGKIYVPDTDGKPFIMYHTVDGYYVTGNSSYVSYKPSGRMIPESPEKAAEYISADRKFSLTIFQEDGNHLIFTLQRNDEPILENAVAVYDAYGTARFEYLSFDGAATGDLTFTYEEGKLSLVTAVFPKEIQSDGTKYSSVSLSVNP